MKREEGYYWVKNGDVWIIAQWTIINKYGSWSVCGNENEYSTNHFDKIDERKIIIYA